MSNPYAGGPSSDDLADATRYLAAFIRGDLNTMNAALAAAHRRGRADVIPLAALSLARDLAPDAFTERQAAALDAAAVQIAAGQALERPSDDDAPDGPER